MYHVLTYSHSRNHTFRYISIISISRASEFFSRKEGASEAWESYPANLFSWEEVAVSGTSMASVVVVVVGDFSSVQFSVDTSVRSSGLFSSPRQSSELLL